MDELRQAGVTDLGLPELFPGEYLVGMMFSLRPTRPSGESDAPTDWDVIWPYAQAMGLDADDADTLSQMCRGYHTARVEGVNPLGIAPVDRR